MDSQQSRQYIVGLAIASSIVGGSGVAIIRKLFSGSRQRKLERRFELMQYMLARILACPPGETKVYNLKTEKPKLYGKIRGEKISTLLKYLRKGFVPAHIKCSFDRKRAELTIQNTTSPPKSKHTAVEYWSSMKDEVFSKMGAVLRKSAYVLFGGSDPNSEALDAEHRAAKKKNLR